MVEVVYDEDSLGVKWDEGPVPDRSRRRPSSCVTSWSRPSVEYDEELLEHYLEGRELEEDEVRRAVRKATLAGAITPVLCGASFKNKGVQKLLDAVIDYLPSPTDKPPVTGHLPNHDEHFVERGPTDDEPFSALVFKIMTDPFVGRLAFFRVYSGILEAGSHILNATQGQEGAHRPPPADARQQARGGGRSSARATCGAPSGCKFARTGDTLCGPGRSGNPGGHELPGAGDPRGDRAQDEGRPGQAVARRWPS